jgi:regulator of cell morphogenesis and NO signaling
MNSKVSEQAPIPEVVDFILKEYHEPLKEELSRLKSLAQKVLSVHRDKDPERLQRLLDAVSQIKDDLEQHLAKEETILFPWILSGRSPKPAAPVQVMLMDHESHAEHLGELRELTGQFQVPANACATWRALWTGLEKLDADLREHIRIENEVLFPRALR